MARLTITCRRAISSPWAITVGSQSSRIWRDGYTADRSSTTSPAMAERFTGSLASDRPSSRRASRSRSSTSLAMRVPACADSADGVVAGLVALESTLAPESGDAQDGGDRGAQFVGGVGDELPKAAFGALLFIEHQVERLRQVSGFGARGHFADAPGPVPGRDGVGDLGHLGDGAEPEAGHPVRRRGQDHEEDDAGDADDHPQPCHGGVDVGEGDGYQQLRSGGGFTNQHGTPARPSRRPIPRWLGASCANPERW